ncbi:MAG TPA: aminopeptidase [Vicinamibacterales bacterium]|nr:aminopeptidase [Vicinamibacterales bacterium]
MSFDARTLQIYAELAVKVALNIQPGQRLLIIGPLANGGASLEAAPLARQIAVAAYRAGSPLVETIYGDEVQQLLRFKNAPRDSFSNFSAWLPRALSEHVAAGHAVLSISANDPDLLHGEPAEIVSAVLQATGREVRPFREQISRNETNWAIVAAASEGWAKKMFPGVPVRDAMDRLWDAIARMCRLDTADPLAAWEAHLANLAARSAYLNSKQYSALTYKGPGTNLTLGLPAGHIWVSGRSASVKGIPFTANLPTEEVFTIAHKDRVDGTVRASKPLSYGSTLVEGFSMTFQNGRVVKVTADRNVDTLERLLDTDEGARRLGEVALVPHGSPISQSGLLYYNTLFDENAASHVALGNAYKFTLKGGNEMSNEQFEGAGGNRSSVHVDFMIGSGDLDVDGVRPDGSAEPLMRSGEWAADG